VPPEILSNFYHMVLLGLNWSKYLKRESPNIPKTITHTLFEEIGTVDISRLVREFGPDPKRSDLPNIEQYLDIDLYLLYGLDFEKINLLNFFTISPKFFQNLKKW